MGIREYPEWGGQSPTAGLPYGDSVLPSLPRGWEAQPVLAKHCPEL